MQYLYATPEHLSCCGTAILVHTLSGNYRTALIVIIGSKYAVMKITDLTILTINLKY
jgi:hypothetical protein